MSKDLPISPDKNRNQTAKTQPEFTPKAQNQTESSHPRASADSQLSKQPDTIILPLVAIREGIMFPQTELVLNFGRKKSVDAVQAAEQYNKHIILVAQKNKAVEDPEPDDLFQIGTIATIERTLNTPNQINALVQGQRRARVVRYIPHQDFFLVEIEVLPDEIQDDTKVDVLAKHLSKAFNDAVSMGKPVEFLNFMKLMSGVNPGELADQVASTLNISTANKQRILETLVIDQRLESVITELSKELKEYQIEQDIIKQTQKSFDKHMKENVLRERLRTIKKELGEMDEEQDEIEELYERLKKAKLPKEAKKKVEREIKRLERLSINNPESGYIRTWLDTVFELPWNKRSKGTVSIKKAEKVLDHNHYGLKEVKDRILEHLAVMQLKHKQTKGKDQRIPTILCFVGAPGVGKTSIGKSIAESLGREFVKVSLGGIRDEAEVRGHRRTYVGAMPGRIINGMTDAKTMNPVFMLDEIDKIGADYRGDPSAALLEALDPEQNNAFSDHYLEVPFDLSEVLFITTANTLSTIPSALLDRLEIIRYSGYTEEEKFHIVKDHLLERVIANNGLAPKQLIVKNETVTNIIQHYSREAGVRELERQINKLVRKVARKHAEGTWKGKTIVPAMVPELLGPEKYDHTIAEEKDEIGLVNGLSWSSVGGDVLFIEVALTKGKGRVQLTGQLGDVMKESAQTALTYVRSQAKKLGIDEEKMMLTDVHIHVPEGATPKDGPSAGIAMTTAIVSAFTGVPVRREVAMTGEVTLRGRVLEIGGLKEKVIAAHRGGVKLVIVPKKNEKDLVEFPDTVKRDVQFKFVERVDEVFALALKS